jgi:MFS family permease
MNPSLIKRLYAYRFLDDFILIYPLYQVMFSDHGLDLVQISWLFVIWSITALAADVPTGVLADRYSRRKLLAFGQLIRAAGFGCWLLAPSFWGYAAGFALWGIGSAFDSGTFEALVFDELKQIGRERDYVRIKGRAQSFGLVGDLLATSGAAVAIVWGYPFVLAMSVGAVLLAGLVAWSIPEAPRAEATGDAGYFGELWAGTREAFSTPALLNVILLGGFITAMFGSLEEYTPIYFQTVGFTLQLIPLGVAALVLAAVGASVVAHRLEHLRTSMFVVGLGISGACLIGAGRLAGVGGAALLGGFFFLTKLLETIYDGKLQHSISSRRRATVTSVSGFAAELMSIGTYIVFGYIARTGGTLVALEWFGLAVMVVAVGYSFAQRRLFSNL